MKELLGVDWRGEWVRHHQARKAPCCAEEWDSRAEDFSRNSGTSKYTSTFIDYLDPAPNSRLLDMGCGSGALALPLARAGHEIFAVDFSAGMLDALNDTAKREGLSNIQTGILDFNARWEEWERLGIRENSVDIALASRSTIVKDLWAALEKLERAARKKVVITSSTGLGPKQIKHLGETVDGRPYVPDYIFAMNILFQMGRFPSLRFIDSEKSNEDGIKRLTRWAYISWQVNERS